jgi:methylmalonyl-CoA mutase N-terminal domain/subunit
MLRTAKSTGACAGARHRAGRYFKRRPGAEHLHFSTEFALKLMGDVQEYFIENNVRNFYSVSISGYHIAEAGANPITQLAFTWPMVLPM